MPVHQYLFRVNVQVGYINREEAESSGESQQHQRKIKVGCQGYRR